MHALKTASNGYQRREAPRCVGGCGQRIRSTAARGAWCSARPWRRASGGRGRCAARARRCPIDPSAALWHLSVRSDPLATGVAVLVAAGVAASLIPSRNAARVDPLVAMRAE